MAKRKRLSKKGKQFLDDLKKTEDANINTFRYPNVEYWISKGKEAHFTEVDKSDLTDYDNAVINSYVSTQADKLLKHHEREIKYFVGEYEEIERGSLGGDEKEKQLANRKWHIDKEVRDSVRAISYLHEKGDKLKAKDYARRIGNILHPIDLHGESKLLKAAEMDKESRLTKIRNIKDIAEMIRNPPSDNYWSFYFFIGGSVLALFFLSPNLTGNTIGNITNTTSNWTGGILLAIGIVGAFLYFRKR